MHCEHIYNQTKYQTPFNGACCSAEDSLSSNLYLLGAGAIQLINAHRGYDPSFGYDSIVKYFLLDMMNFTIYSCLRHGAQKLNGLTNENLVDFLWRGGGGGGRK